MKAPPDPAWQETWRELRQLAWALLLIDVIALALGFMAAEKLGSFARMVGVGLAAFVTVCFVLIIGGNLIVAWLLWLKQKRNHVTPDEHSFNSTQEKEKV